MLLCSLDTCTRLLGLRILYAAGKPNTIRARWLTTLLMNCQLLRLEFVVVLLRDVWECQDFDVGSRARGFIHNFRNSGYWFYNNLANSFPQLFAQANRTSVLTVAIGRS